MEILEKRPLGDLMRKPVSSLNPKDHQQEVFNYYSIPAYDEGAPIKELGKEIGSSKKVLKNGDVLISRIVPHLQRVWIVDENSAHKKIGSSEWIVFNTDKVLPDYLRYFLLSEVFHNQFMETITGVGGSLMRANKKQTEKIKIPVCPFDQQKAIVAKLDRAQRLIDIDNEMLAKYDELIQSVFLEMFGDPVTNPKEWDRKPMEEIGELKSGGTPSRKNKEYFTGDIDWYTTGELESMYLGEAEEKITETAIEESSAKLFEKGSLLIGMYDTSAFKLGILAGPGSSNQASANIKLDDEICNVQWLYYCLKIMRPSILHERRGIRQKNLTLGFLKKLEIIMPPLENQLQFSNSLKRISDEKHATEKSGKQSEELFSSLVQGAFG